jgi:hypothetical protein
MDRQQQFARSLNTNSSSSQHNSSAQVRYASVAFYTSLRVYIWQSMCLPQ